MTESSSSLPQMLAFPSIFATALVLVTKVVAAKRPDIRKCIVQNPLWKGQMFLHPVIVFTLLYQAVRTQAPIYASLIVPFAFNFGVESFEIPTDPIFLAFYYLHHYALVLGGACVLVVDNEQLVGFGTSQALLLGHAWGLHTISFATHKKWIDKQQSFWPYIMSGFLLKLSWWSTIQSIPALSILRLPVYAQYIGRWGLLLRLCEMFPFMRDPKGPHYDGFEWQKQPAEALAFVVSYLVAKFIR